MYDGRIFLPSFEIYVAFYISVCYSWSFDQAIFPIMIQFYTEQIREEDTFREREPVVR